VAIGTIGEEANEHEKSAASLRMAQQSRALRNEGRVENGKEPMTNKPSTDLITLVVATEQKGTEPATCG